MKAAVCTSFGLPDVIHIQDLPKPVPHEREILIRIHASTVNSGDARIRAQRFPTGMGFLAKLMFGFKKPKKPILGVELSGVIESCGSRVTRFKVGDALFAMTGMKMGAHAEYICLPESGAIAIKPASLPFEEAAALSFGGTTALYFLRDQGHVQAGEKVLIIGGSGAVGSAAIQIAKHLQAHVTAVCSTKNKEMVLKLGADKVIDYTQEDYLQSNASYDLVMDTVGVLNFKKAQPILNKKGRLLLVVAGFPEMLSIPLVAMTSDKKIIAGTASEKHEDLETLARLADQGQIKPLIGQTFCLEQIKQAHALVDTGHKVGSLIVTLAV